MRSSKFKIFVTQSGRVMAHCLWTPGLQRQHVINHGDHISKELI